MSTVLEGLPNFLLYSAKLNLKGFPFSIILARTVFLQTGFHCGFTRDMNLRNDFCSVRDRGSSFSIMKSTTASVMLCCTSELILLAWNGFFFGFWLLQILYFIFVLPFEMSLQVCFGRCSERNQLWGFIWTKFAFCFVQIFVKDKIVKIIFCHFDRKLQCSWTQVGEEK